MSVIIAGDIHGEIGILNTLINKKRPTELIACGDFGIWECKHFMKFRKKGITSGYLHEHIKTNGTKIYFCDGNHEDHNFLDSLRMKNDDRREPIEITENIFYCPRGSTVELSDGTKTLFMGGAESIDKAVRTAGHDWFPQEVITDTDMKKLPVGEKIDMVISHTCPSFCQRMLKLPKLEATWLNNKYFDPSCVHLTEVYNIFKPKQWYFGHFHVEDNFYIYGRRRYQFTHFHALSCTKYGHSTKWWEWYKR